ncbi:hypothetical protein E4U58_004767 [Claviceps cyperi]|nr:hypothetical protein E4U58_004767 [Claviceps cyperi]
MSAEVHVDRQPQSPLAQLPAELGRQIYAYIAPAQVHLYRHNNTICAATCITPTPSSDYYCFDRRSLGDPPTAVWARRLASPWGEHWRCEEVAKRLHHDTPHATTPHDTAVALMASCRRIYEDVACLVADTSVIHVNDLATLDLLLFNRRDKQSRSSSSPGSLLTRAFLYAKRLNISLHLPPPIFQAIAAKKSPPTRAAPSSPTVSSPSIAWACLWRNLSALSNLQHVNITLDHDSRTSWSGVNEHTILAPLQTLASRPHINTTIHLPKVASTNGNGTALGLTIKRFTRQRFYTDYRKDGSIGVVYEEDALKSFHRPGPDAAEILRAADLTMHIWVQGVDLDYAAMDESSDLDGDAAYDAI